jgi:hypothetical protein
MTGSLDNTRWAVRKNAATLIVRQRRFLKERLQTSFAAGSKEPLQVFRHVSCTGRYY